MENELNETNQVNNDLSLSENLDEDDDAIQQTNNNKTLDKAIARKHLIGLAA